MALAAGDKLGPYEILALIGAGGMGEVYKARDTRLDRTVALKISKSEFSERFEREARNVAQLNHPNICTLHDVGPNYLVMEFVEGETLSGPLPLDICLNYARQIAEAIEAAHEKGIVHRDLKPANIKVTPEGAIKVLDFGLAKALDAELPAAPPQDSPTLSMAMTRAGMILGTAAYMSPEQAKGRPADRRADIWAFGVVLYEMLVGRQVFTGETAAETLASVLKEPISFDRLPKETPLAVRNLLARCLERDLRQRLQAIGEARIALNSPSSPADAPPPVALAPTRPLRWIVAAVVATLTAAAFAFVHFREKPPVAEVIRFQVPPPDKTNFGAWPAVLSPDGRKLAFMATGSDGRGLVWVRSLDTLESRPLTGSEGVTGEVMWSPDSRSVTFGISSQLKLKRIEVAGGPAQTLCDITQQPVDAWSREGVIIFRGPNGLLRVPAAGGACTPVTVLDAKRGEARHTVPSFLPDGKHFVYLRVFSKAEDSGIYIGSLDSKPEQQSSQRLLAATVGAVYARSTNDPSLGYLLFLREGSLMAQPFNPAELKLTGDAVPIAEQVASNSGGDMGTFSVSETGTLAYRTGGSTGNRQLAWYDRTGKQVGSVAEPGDYNTLALSPDGTRVAFQRSDSQGNNDIWIHEIARGTSTRFTFDPLRDWMPVWSPDGERIVFGTSRDGPDSLYQKVSTGAGSEEVLLKSGEMKFPQDWSRDGRFLLYSNADPKNNLDLWVLPLQGERKPKLFLGTPFRESQGRFSPDGRFISYTSNESGRDQVYVRPFSPEGNASGQWMVSKDGGTEARWSRDGKELFYISPDSKLVAVPVSTSPTFKAGIPEALFPAPIYGGGNVNNVHRWDTTDGKRFLINTPLTETVSAPITVVVNWQAALKK